MNENFNSLCRKNFNDNMYKLKLITGIIGLQFHSVHKKKSLKFEAFYFILFSNSRTSSQGRPKVNYRLPLHRGIIIFFFVCVCVSVLTAAPIKNSNNLRTCTQNPRRTNKHIVVGFYFFALSHNNLSLRNLHRPYNY